MDWRIRRASIGDAEHLSVVGAATFLETFAGILDGSAIVAHCFTEHGAATYRRYLDDPASATWLAETATGAAPIGYGLVAPSSLPGTDPGGRDLELKRIYTLSRFHGAGLGSELMNQAVDYAVAQAAGRLLLGVYAHNERAIAFYRKNGFDQIGERRFAVGNREYDDVVLAKSL